MTASRLFAIPFRPFSLAVWMIILAFIFLSAFILYVTEDGRNVQVFSRKQGFRCAIEIVCLNFKG